MPTKKTARRLLWELVEAVENAVSAFEFDCFPGDIWEPYCEARAFLGSPIEMFKGGYEGKHFHFISFDPKRDTCCACEDEAEDEANAKADAP